MLLAAIDDATSQVLAAVLRPAEDLVGYCALLEQMLTRHGLPLAIYSDRLALHFSPRHGTHSVAEELGGIPRPLSQFGRMLAELRIEHIPAHSPQAKGRVERLFQTLQGRLPTLFRLAGVTTLEAANVYLEAHVPQFNRQFAVHQPSPRRCFGTCPPTWN